MTSSELIHYGVKGMKWGVRRAELAKDNPSYTRGQRDYDYTSRGVSRRGVKRINKRINKGQSLEVARKNEKKFVKRRNTAIGLAVAAAKYGNPEARANFRAVYEFAASTAAYKVAQRAETKRGEAHAAYTMGLPQNARSNGPSSYTKKRRNGAYNISSL